MYPAAAKSDPEENGNRLPEPNLSELQQGLMAAPAQAPLILLRNISTLFACVEEIFFPIFAINAV
jgi:hypothetical protein